MDEWSDLAHAGVGFELINVMACLIQEVDHLVRNAISVSFANFGMDENLIDSAVMLVHIIRYVVHTTLFARAGRERGAAVGSGGGG